MSLSATAVEHQQLCPQISLCPNFVALSAELERNVKLNFFL
ncbi:hypothetical protein [Fortiea sp. LEGE XX443]|nr:hypothetical protein [Fortiea sp. LEGE XX443]